MFSQFTKHKKYRPASQNQLGVGWGPLPSSRASYQCLLIPQGGAQPGLKPQGLPGPLLDVSSGQNPDMTPSSAGGRTQPHHHSPWSLTRLRVLGQERSAFTCPRGVSVGTPRPVRSQQMQRQPRTAFSTVCHHPSRQGRHHGGTTMRLSPVCSGSAAPKEQWVQGGRLAFGFIAWC